MFFENKPLLIAIVLFVTLFILMIITAGTNNIEGVPSIVGGILEPVQGVFYSVTDSIIGFFGGFTTDAELEAENNLLREQVIELTAELTELNEIRQENERLRELLAYKQDNRKLESITARVTGKYPVQWATVYTINAGVSSGVQKDMAVINAQGLIGRVIETGANWARVLAITDSSSGVAGVIERTRDPGIIKGTMFEGASVMTMEFLPLDADLMPGDKVMTSGVGGIFPEGIPIGTITAVSFGQNSTQTSATLIPAVDFVHLEEVMVITQVIQEN